MARVKAKLRSFKNRFVAAMNAYGQREAHRVLSLHGFTYNPETQRYERPGD